MISVICVYDNKDIFEKWIENSLKKQNYDYQLIKIDNSNKKFKSASQALNYGSKFATGEYLLFVHQDIKFCCSDWLKIAKKYIENLEKKDKLGIVGVAGVRSCFSNKRFRNIIYEHENPIKIWGNPIENPELVQTLDECLFIISKNVFKINQFDEEVCDNWHFYAVDFCLSIKRLGFKSYVIPLKVHHQSEGFYKKLSFNVKSIKHLIQYYASLKKIVKKHGADNDFIFTTNGIYDVNRTLYLQDIKRKIFEFFEK